jgi:hypothetical protein
MRKLAPNIEKIIEILGGMDSLRNNPIHLKLESYMPLNIEWIGYGPRDWPLISVMHTFEQHGDLCRDPDVEIEIPPAGVWSPISYRQDSLGMMQEALWVEDGRVLMRPKLLRELRTFLRQWDKNIGEQGFVDEARRLATERKQ